jgi:lipoyl(octanoyl) transferase
MAQQALVFHLGRVPYRPAWELQRQVQERMIGAKRSVPAEPVPHAILVVEHPPVYTLGKSGDARHLLANQAELEAISASFVPVDRGGDITYHGPGQIVIYPILDLDRIRPDIHAYLRGLEHAVAETCAQYDLVAGGSASGTGVWVLSGGTERKICALGIRCSRWVTMHGLAFNANTDLSYFDHIIPCGISDRSVTSLARETGSHVDISNVTSQILTCLGEQFGLEMEQRYGMDACKRLSAFTGRALPEGLLPLATP